MRRRDFLIATGVAGTACLPTPSVRAFGGLQAATADPSFHVYLAFWQSNMEGFPGIEAADKEDDGERDGHPGRRLRRLRRGPVNYRRYGCGPAGRHDRSGAGWTPRGASHRDGPLNVAHAAGAPVAGSGITLAAPLTRDHPCGAGLAAEAPTPVAPNR
jgi:hypothetical protein